MLYIILVLFGLFFLRKIGWFLCKNGLYESSAITVTIVCIIWGTLIAYCFYLLSRWQNPHYILMIIGYGAGAYVSILNYGLLKSDSVPKDKFLKHNLIFFLPLFSFIISSITLYLV
jgi:hypothetical protein